MNILLFLVLFSSNKLVQYNQFILRPLKYEDFVNYWWKAYKASREEESIYLILKRIDKELGYSNSDSLKKYFELLLEEKKIDKKITGLILGKILLHFPYIVKIDEDNEYSLWQKILLNDSLNSSAFLSSLKSLYYLNPKFPYLRFFKNELKTLLDFREYANYLYMNGFYSEAIIYLEPLKYERAYWYLKSLYLSGLYEKFKSEFERLVNFLAREELLEINYYVGVSLEKMGDTTQAESTYLKLMFSGESFWAERACFQLSKIWLLRGELDKISSLVKDTVYPSHVNSFVARVYLALDDEDRAINWFRKNLLSKGFYRDEALFMLWRLTRERGYLEELLSKGPDNYFAGLSGEFKLTRESKDINNCEVDDFCLSQIYTFDMLVGLWESCSISLGCLVYLANQGLNGLNPFFFVKHGYFINRWDSLLLSIKFPFPKKWVEYLEEGNLTLLFAAILYEESKFNFLAISPAGAVGLSQLMPQYFGGKDVLNPLKNLKLGYAHIKSLIDKFLGDTLLAVMAYNAGEGVVNRYLKIYREKGYKYDGLLFLTFFPIRETRIYTRKVLRTYNIYKALYGKY